MMNFQGLVLRPNMVVFAGPITLMPLVSQGTGAAPVIGRGIMTSNRSNFMLDDGAIFSDQTTTLGIRLIEWPIRPMKDDQILIDDPAWDGLIEAGLYRISDITLDRQGGATLTIRDTGTDIYQGQPTVPPPKPIPPPTCSITPTAGPDTGGTMITIKGTNLANATAVRFGITPAQAFSRIDDTTLTALSPDGTGTVAVSVTTPSGTSPMSADNQFRFISPRPTVTTVSPNQGPSSGGTGVLITGTNFTKARAVRFGGVEASFAVAADNTINVAAPGGTGTVDVTVINDAGESAISAADRFTYT